MWLYVFKIPTRKYSVKAFSLRQLDKFEGVIFKYDNSFLKFKLKTTHISIFSAKCDTKISLSGSFWAGILKNYYHIWNEHPQVCLIAKFHSKMKILKFRTTNTLLACFAQQLWKTFVTFKISPLEFVLLQSLVQIKKPFNLGPKIPGFGFFLSSYLKIILLYSTLAPSNLSNCEILWNNTNA